MSRQVQPRKQGRIAEVGCGLEDESARTRLSQQLGDNGQDPPIAAAGQRYHSFVARLAVRVGGARLQRLA